MDFQDIAEKTGTKCVAQLSYKTNDKLVSFQFIYTKTAEIYEFPLKIYRYCT